MFRPQDWLMSDLELVMEKENCGKTEAIHKYISYLKKEARTAKQDLQTYKDFYDKKPISKPVETEPFYCLVWNDTLVTPTQCAECINKKLNPTCPKITHNRSV